MAQRLIFSLLLAMTLPSSTEMMNSTAAPSAASTAVMNSTAAPSVASTAVMNSTAAPSVASTAVMNSTAAPSVASTAVMNSTAAPSAASTAVMNSTAAPSVASTAVMNSTAAPSAASTAVMSSTAAATTVAMTTTAIGTTGFPILTPNSEIPISNDNCSSTQLCAAEPGDCDPAVSRSCSFIGARQTGGRNFEFALSGQSDGYIGCTLSPDATLGGNDITYVCANNNGSVQFIGAVFNNDSLSQQTVNANSVRGRINGNQIQCTFRATVPDARARTTATTFSLAAVSGSFSKTFESKSHTSNIHTHTRSHDLPSLSLSCTCSSPGGGNLGTPRLLIQTGPLELSDFTATSIASTAVMSSTAAATTIPISNDNCSSTQLCAAEPGDCDPAVSRSCSFIGARQTGGRNFEFALSGQSDGYIGCTLSPDATLGGNDITYVCANNNGSVQFIGAVFNNDSLSQQTVNTNSVRGRINGNQIQCTFRATVPDTTARTTATTFSVAAISGSFSNGVLGDPTAIIQTNVVDISNTTSDTSNRIIASTTIAPTTPTTMAPTTPTTMAPTTPTTMAPTTSSGRLMHQALSQDFLNSLMFGQRGRRVAGSCGVGVSVMAANSVTRDCLQDKGRGDEHPTYRL
ncbi:putative ferric-chelate reductase 1 [Merluccius polli]|uniref:Ferric-chelate reductase 1 n=1 Tax=Merluccius polli TaxID=89951 RepID=A0AA47N797_MERPO|nr:putative ferric-chelate reductase 1 [Merluccius polli]